MRGRNLPLMLPLWEDERLAQHDQRALEDFVERRLGEPDGRYAQHLLSRKAGLKRLLREISDFDPQHPDIESARRIVGDRELLDALRYLAGPPISADDLGVLVTKRPARLSGRILRSDPDLARSAISLICRLADNGRFPWVRQQRPPRRHELKLAIRATASLHAAQTMQTERRGYGKKVETLLRARLETMGYARQRAPNKGKLTAPAHFPAARTFYGECSLYGRWADLIIGLSDGRIVATESKDSSSIVNSVKRVLNDTAAKAQHWRDKFGEIVIPVALLSGVFGLNDLRNAQASGLHLVWAHDLDTLVAWLESTHADR